MTINPNSHVPIYEQIADQIRGAVAAGVYRPKEMVPSVRTLALELVVNPNTVQRAYLELEREGLVFKRKGRGVFVSENGVKSARNHSEAAVFGRFSQGIQIAQAARMPVEQVQAIFDKATLDQATGQAVMGSNPSSAPKEDACGSKKREQT